LWWWWWCKKFNMNSMCVSRKFHFIPCTR
jgi:hypothetical protein